MQTKEEWLEDRHDPNNVLESPEYMRLDEERAVAWPLEQAAADKDAMYSDGQN